MSLIKTMKAGAAAGALATLSASLASPAAAEQKVVVFSNQQTSDDASDLNAAKSIFDSLKPGDEFLVLNSQDGAIITDIEIPNKSRFNMQNYREKEFAQNIREIVGFVQERAATGPQNGQSDPMSTLRAIGQLKREGDKTIHVLYLGSAIYNNPADPGVSMLDDERNILVPSDGLLAADSMISPYGQDTEDRSLEGVLFHWCPSTPVRASMLENKQTGRFWTHYIRRRGGDVVMIADDPQLCQRSFDEKRTTPVEVTPFDKYAPPAMVSYSSGRAINRVTIGGATGDNKTATELEEEIFGPDRLEGLTTFSRFTKINHPSKPWLTVSTGVEYQRQNFPAWDSAWCYMSIRNVAGSRVHLSIGEKSPGKKATWEKHDIAVLRDISLTAEDIRKARASCRFPEG